MKRFCLFCLCLLCLSVWGASAQVVEKILDIFGADSLSNSKVAVTADSDSVHLSTVKKELAAARLNEANLRMEIEQMKLAAYTADSVKLASQRRRIDSLRHETRGVPVVVDGDTLFYFYAKRGGHTPQQRAENVANDITALGKRFNLKPDSVYIETSDIVTDVMYDNKVLVSFTDQDGLWESCTRDQLAAKNRLVIIEKLKVMKEEHGLIIHSEVSIGYDVPWRVVNKLLIEAALNTPGVVDDPRPFVLSTSLSDWYPVYQVNAYIKDADRLADIYSALHQNIQDRFNEEGVEIMSPHYMAVRDGNASTIPPKEGADKEG